MTQNKTCTAESPYLLGKRVLWGVGQTLRGRKARTLYSRYEPIASYDDNAICAQSPAYKQKQSDENMMQFMHNSDETALMHSLIDKAPVLATNEVKAYPNPANDVLYIAYSFEQKKERQLNIYDVSGRKVHSAVLPIFDTQIIIDLRQWANGLFTYQIMDGIENYTGKIIVNK